MIFCSLFCDIIFLILILFSVHRKALLLGYIFCLFFAYLCYCAFLPVFVLLIYKQIYIYIGGGCGSQLFAGRGHAAPILVPSPRWSFLHHHLSIFLSLSSPQLHLRKCLFYPPIHLLWPAGRFQDGEKEAHLSASKRDAEKIFLVVFFYLF